MKDIIVTNPSKKQNSDAGMALTLILLILGFLLESNLYFKVAVAAVLINMTVPVLFFPFSVFWYSLSGLLGTVMSKILLTIIFYLVVVPIGLIRIIAGKDSLKLKQFGKGKETVFVERNHQYTNEDIEQPY